MMMMISTHDPKQQKKLPSFDEDAAAYGHSVYHKQTSYFCFRRKQNEMREEKKAQIENNSIRIMIWEKMEKTDV